MEYKYWFKAPKALLGDPIIEITASVPVQKGDIIIIREKRLEAKVKGIKHLFIEGEPDYTQLWVEEINDDDWPNETVVL